MCPTGTSADSTGTGATLPTLPQSLHRASQPSCSSSAHQQLPHPEHQTTARSARRGHSHLLKYSQHEQNCATSPRQQQRPGAQRRFAKLGVISKPWFSVVLLLQLCVLLCATSFFSNSPISTVSAAPVFPLDIPSTPDAPPPPLLTILRIEQLLGHKGITHFVGDDDGPLILDVGQRTVISTQNAVLGSFFTVFGLVLVLFGYKLLRATLVFMGFVAWALITIVIMVVCKWTLASQLFRPSHYLFWMWFLAGIVGGLLALRYWELGLIFTGGFGGFALAMGIIGACDDHLSSTGRYVLLVYLIFVGAILPTFCERFVITISTSFGGAFMFMYGIDEFLQLGYRDIIVVFQFAGRAFSYHADRKVFIMLGSTLAFAVVGIVWEFWWHRTPLWMNEKALFSIRGRPFGKRPHQLMGERLLRRMRRSLCLRLKKARGMPYGEDQEDSTVKQGQAQNKQYQGQPTIIVVDDGSSNIGKLSNKSDTYIGSDSGISAKTTSSLNVEDADAQEKERAQRWSALSASTLTPPMDELHSKNIQGGGQGQRWSALSSATLSPSIEERNDKDEGNKTGGGSDTKSIQSFEKKGD